MVKRISGKLLRVFLCESHKHEGAPLYEWIIKKAREHNLAGATVLRGMEGFGAHKHLHTAKVLTLSSDLPLVVEIADTAENIEHFISSCTEALDKAISAIEEVELLLPEG